MREKYLKFYMFIRAKSIKPYKTNLIMKNLFVLLTFGIIFIATEIFAQEQNFEKAFFPDKMNYNYRNITLSSSNTGNYDLKYYRFDISVDPAVNFISGSVTPRFLVTKENTNNIYFDFNDKMTVDSIKYHGQLVNSVFSGHFELKIDLPGNLIKGQMDSITIWYSGNPTTSGFGSFETSKHYCDKTIPVLWTLSEPYGARDWWPTKQSLNDKIDSIDMFVTTPKGYKVGSNGLLVSRVDIADKTIHHWKHNYPEPAYLIAIAVSDYAEYIDWVPLKNGDSLMVLEYVYPCNLDYAKSKTSDIIPTMQFYIDLFGDYSFDKEKYGHAQFGWGGGMEHSTMTFVSSFGHSLLAHELAHQWFGDKITCGSWQDIWLNEGFATYLEGLTYDFGRNPDNWENWKTGKKNSAISSPHGSVYVYDTTSVSRIFNGSLSYSKGAYLLHMLRWKLGDDNFFQALRDYISDPELIYGYARTPDLQKHFEAQSGQDLNEFFKDWLYGKGFPTYSLDWGYDENNKLFVRVFQTQSDESVDYFEMPVPIQLVGEGRDTIVVLDNVYNEQIFTLDIDFKVDSISFDPDQWLCAKIQDINYLNTNKINNGDHDILVYPNPVVGNININLGKRIFVDDISLFDMNGLLIKNFSVKENKQNIKINVSEDNVFQGLFLIRIVSGKGVYIKKINFVK